MNIPFLLGPLFFGAVLCNLTIIHQCESDWTYFEPEKSCYKRLFQLRWDDAEALCRSYDSHLTSIHSDEEVQFLVHIAKAMRDPVPFTGAVWTGLRRFPNSTKWYNADGTPVDYFKWADLQPDNDNNVEDCVMLISDHVWDANQQGHYIDFYPGKFNDFNCNLQIRISICKKAACNKPSENSSTVSCDSYWTYFDQTKSCYKIMYEANFSTAESMCNSESAHLTSINSLEENAFIIDLCKCSFPAILTYQGGVGMRRIADSVNDWYNLDGTQVDFFNWAENQPENAFNNENCVQLTTDRWPDSPWYEKWSDVNCNTTMRAFVCKKPANFNMS